MTAAVVITYYPLMEVKKPKGSELLAACLAKGF